VGGFEVLGRLGKGGMGTVLKARQVSMDRIVALKILPKRFASNEVFVQRFLREARSAAKLSHPNIVQGIDVGHADGYYYFAMEYVDGSTVRDLLQAGGTVDEARALDIATGIAHALEHAQKHDIVHRDIKPENVMITKDGVVKLADLGLARSTGVVDTVTVEGSALGTPHFMSPEQAEGHRDVDTRADIYSLGATLFRMVTGEYPYDGPTALAVAMKHVTQPVPIAAERRPEVASPLSELIAWMMEKKREDRPQSPAALLRAVERVRKGLPPRPGQEPTRPVRKGKVPWLVAGAAVLAIGAVIGLATRDGSEKPKAQTPKPAAKTVVEHPAVPEPKQEPEKAAPETPGPAETQTVTEEPDDPAPFDDPSHLPGGDFIPRPRNRLKEFLKNRPIRRPFPPTKGGFPRPPGPLEEPVERVERPTPPTPAVTTPEPAKPEYGPESDRVWALLRERKYAEADKALAALAANGDFGDAKDHLAADREALTLLRDLWQVVEKGLAARVGKFVSVAGAVGTLESVQDGVMTVKTPRGPETRRVDQLTGKQAISYAGLGKDDRSKRMAAVLLLAEADARDDAAEAVGHMADTPTTAFYKARLAALPETQAAPAESPTHKPAAHETPKPEPAKSEWTDLFDGTSLDGWTTRGPRPSAWKAHGGMLVNVERGADLFTTRDFMNFDLSLEFKLPKDGNSGVYLRGRKEVQLFDSYGKRDVDAQDCGAIYNVQAPKVNAARPAGEWNTLLVRVVGDRIRVILNGRTVIQDLAVAHATGQALGTEVGTPGPILLQGRLSAAAFRKIRIRPLP